MSVPARALALLVATPALVSPIRGDASSIGTPVPNRIASALGVNIHQLRDPERELAAMQAAGIRFVRLDISWDRVETARGTYDWSAWDGPIAAMARHGIRPVLLLAYSNPLYAPVAAVPGRAAGPLPPTSAAAREAYARYAVATAVHYRRFDPVLEIWNEPNRDGFWPPHASAFEYAQLAGEACTRMRAAAPGLAIVAPGLAHQPGSADADFAYLQAFAGSAAARCVSAISVHPYLFVGSLDAAPRWWQRAREATQAAAKPLVVTETGLSTFSNQYSALDQASYLVRNAVYGSEAGVGISIWYDWRDDGTAPADPEAHFGLTDVDGRPKPPLQAMTILSRMVAGYASQCRRADGNTVRVTFSGAGDRRLVLAWDIGPGGRTPGGAPLQVRLPAGAQAIRAIDMLGHAVPLQRTGDGVRITTGNPPFYLDYRGANAPACG